MLRTSCVSALLLIVGLSVQPAFAETPDDVLAALKSEAAKSTPEFQGFSAARGEKFFKLKHGNEWSCSSCHTDNPAATGKHAKTEKPIDPMAPSANAERFTNPKKIEKWFKRNCNDVLDRVCTPLEKGDVLSYLLAVKK
jgi:mono/diheme cytochrome c family protein